MFLSQICAFAGLKITHFRKEFGRAEDQNFAEIIRALFLLQIRPWLVNRKVNEAKTVLF